MSETEPPEHPQAQPVRSAARAHLYYVLRNKEPVAVSFLEWAVLRAAEDWQIADSRIGETRVSTVFLGIDHGFGDGPPVLFETMIFGGALDQQQARACTYHEALLIHSAACTAVHESLTLRWRLRHALCLALMALRILPMIRRLHFWLRDRWPIAKGARDD